MADGTNDIAPEDAALAAALKTEIDDLFGKCAKGGHRRAAYFLRANQDQVLRIALRARKEPKKRAMPSPFIYSMQ